MNEQNYQNVNIIENDIETDIDKKVIRKQMTQERVAVSNAQLPEGYEIEEPIPSLDEENLNAVFESAEKENLVREPIGNTPLNEYREDAPMEPEPQTKIVQKEDAPQEESKSPEEIMDAFKNQIGQDAKEVNEKAAKIEIDKSKAIMATRDDLFATAEKPFTFYVQWKNIPRKFKAKRITESDHNSLINREIAEKTINPEKYAELTQEEKDEINAFKRKVLAKMVVEPKLSEKEWSERVALPLMNDIHFELNKYILDIDAGDEHNIAETEKK